MGGGGGAYFKNQDQIINNWIIRHGTSEVTRWHCGRVSNLRTIKLKSGRLLMVRETFASAKGASR